MNRGIKWKLLISFFGVALVSLLTINLLVNVAISITFNNYLDNERKAEANNIAQELMAEYDPNRQWSGSSLMEITHQALLNHMNLRIYNQQHALLWDSTQMMGNQNKESGNDSLQTSKLSTIQIPLKKGSISIGSLELQYSKNFFSEQEKVFLTSFNTLSWFALGIVLLGVYFFSYFIAKGISAPLIRIKEVAIRLRDGDLLQRVPLQSTNDEIDQVAISINHLADTLEEQERLRKHLTADIAHELRTPLATIRSYLEAFQDGVWEPTEEKLQICYDQIMQLVHLIKDLEHLADVENPMLKIKKEPIDLVQLVQDAIQSVQGNWSHKTIQLQTCFKNTELTDRKMYISGDYHRLLQVFINLLNNAYKYTPENGKIEVQFEEEAHHILVHVQDTGAGIPHEELPNIFERFYRGEKSRNRKTGGAGIGLTIVKAIVEAHGGSVTVSSVVNQGSKFTVRLPKESGL